MSNKINMSYYNAINYKDQTQAVKESGLLPKSTNLPTSCMSSTCIWINNLFSVQMSNMQTVWNVKDSCHISHMVYYESLYYKAKLINELLTDCE